jgi:hypothetical protein
MVGEPVGDGTELHLRDLADLGAAEARAKGSAHRRPEHRVGGDEPQVRSAFAGLDVGGATP